MQKLYYSISELSRLVDEEAHILRYWQKEFEALNPKKNRGGNRIYSEKEVLVVMAIKKLLRGDKLSLKGAKVQLERLLENNEIEKYVRSSTSDGENQSDVSVFPFADGNLGAKFTEEPLTSEMRELYNALNSLYQVLKNS